jgi:Kef-type K+ transport system membrane component KefB
LALVLVYALSAEWLGSVAGITGAYLLGYVFATSEYKADVERSFYAIGHGFLIPLFFVSIGLSSDYRALGGHWALLLATLAVAIIGKLIGCGFAALASGMDWVRSLRIGCGMISRGEVGLIVTAMGASTGIFGRSEVAVMVAVVLLTTLLTPLVLRGAFHLSSQQDIEEGLTKGAPAQIAVVRQPISLPSETRPESAEAPPNQPRFRMRTSRGTDSVSLS